MKPLLFLPMVALLCFGCSKENIQGNDDPGLTTQNSSSDLIDLVYSGPGYESLIIPSTKPGSNTRMPTDNSGMSNFRTSLLRSGFKSPGIRS